MSYPIVDVQSGITDVAFVVLNLVEFGELATKLPLPEATTLTIVNRDGVVLARHPGDNDIIGRKLDSGAAPRNVRQVPTAYFTAVTPRAQLTAYESVTESIGGPAALRVLVSMPLSVVYADANQTLFRTLACVLLVTLVLLVAAWYGAERFFLRNVRTLLATANRLRGGDLTARTGMRYGNEELSQIGKSFDEMAETLHERQKRIDDAIVTLHQQSITDALTRLHNRRYLYETLPREIVRAKRNESTIAVIIVDLDHFKRINDSYGHEAGDMALRWVGSVLMKSVRGSDIVCRHGGEEFCVALPEASQESARAKAEEIRQALQELNLDYCGQPLKITASFGIAVYPEHGTDADTLLRHADEALYDAKSGGRNRVMVFSKDVAFQKSHVSSAAAERVSGMKGGGAGPMAVVSDIAVGRRPPPPPPGPAAPSPGLALHTPGPALHTPGPTLHPVETGGALDRPAAIQILTGPLVGQEFTLTNNASTVGKAGSEIAVITRSSQGYFLTHIEGPKYPVVNGATIESRARRLSNRDVLEVAGVKMVFFYK